MGSTVESVKGLKESVEKFDRSSSRLSLAMFFLALIQTLIVATTAKLSLEISIVITVLMALLLVVFIKTSPLWK